MTFSSSQQIVLASGNPGKIKEIQAILAGHPIVPQSAFNVAEAEETGSTFVENAIEAVIERISNVAIKIAVFLLFSIFNFFF